MSPHDNTFDRTVFSLCCEIDSLKEQVDYWRGQFEAERAENINSINERLEESKKGIANALLFALSCSDDENGNLVIKKDDRKTLAKSIR